MNDNKVAAHGSATHSRRDVLKSTTKALGAYYLAPATIGLLTAERATAASCMPCPSTVTRRVYSYSSRSITVRYQCCQGLSTTITAQQGWNADIEMYAPQTCQVIHYCGTVENVSISTRVGLTLVLRDQCTTPRIQGQGGGSGEE